MEKKLREEEKARLLDEKRQRKEEAVVALGVSDESEEE